MSTHLVSLSYDCCFHAFVSDKVLLRIRKHNGIIREANVEFCDLPGFLPLVYEYPRVLECVVLYIHNPTIALDFTIIFRIVS